MPMGQAGSTHSPEFAATRLWLKDVCFIGDKVHTPFTATGGKCHQPADEIRASLFANRKMIDKRIMKTDYDYRRALVARVTNLTNRYTLTTYERPQRQMERRTSAFFRSLIDFMSDGNVVRDAEKQEICVNNSAFVSRVSDCPFRPTNAYLWASTGPTSGLSAMLATL